MEAPVFVTSAITEGLHSFREREIPVGSFSLFILTGLWHLDAGLCQPWTVAMQGPDHH